MTRSFFQGIMLFFSVLLSVVGSGSCFAAPTNDAPYQLSLPQGLSLDGRVFFLVDTSRSHSSRDFGTDQFESSFSRWTGRTPSFGMTASAVWLRTTLNNPTDNSVSLFFELGVACIHHVEFFLRDSVGNVTAASAGFLTPLEKRPLPYRWPVFPITLQPHETQTVYVRCESGTALILPLKLYSVAEYIRHDRTRESLLGWYFGALAIMALFNAFMFVFIRDRSYLLYAAFILSLGFGQIIGVYGWDFGGPLDQFLKAHLSFPLIPQYLTVVFAMLFARGMLQTRISMPLVDKCVLVFVGVVALLMSSTMFTSYSRADHLLALCNIAGSLAMTIISVVLVVRGNRVARYYLIATALSMVAFIGYNLMYGWGVLPFSQVLYFSPNSAFVVTMLLFALGLADRYVMLTEERQHAQEMALANLQERNRLLNETARLESELYQSRKLEAIGKLAGGMAHDLRNILTPISGYTQLIQRRTESDAKMQTYTAKILEASDIAGSLVSNLLTFSRKGPTQWSLIDINATVRDAIGLLRHSLGSRIAITVECTEGLPSIRGDGNQIKNMLLNLAINARDAMPDGGEILIHTGLVAFNGSEPVLHTMEIPAGRYLFLSLADSGMGMPPDIVEHIFEPYFTTKGPDRGTGLGLASVYGCVKSHEGGVAVVSDVGKGTTITLYLPVLSNKNTPV